MVAERRPASGSGLYDDDILLWSAEQAAHLRARRFDRLDIAHLIEEIEDLGASQKRALEAHLYNILRHMLKLTLSPSGEPRKHWKSEVSAFRIAARRDLRRTPSLKHHIDKLFENAWEDARDAAIADFAAFDEAVAVPETCPWTLEDVLNGGEISTPAGKPPSNHEQT
ncbi:DUF29 domain-containing protein [Zavarzinia compransoris]|uniref:DUF29 domain-containing protein n=1 Tax=Zavarzinia compransoris TaxID=1264899 RepID=A0A317EC63_9PROT|nr:DUF29 domain-containing protein [Zavarzinia compransoris]PWR23884.1 DUF29 domain-containing protein [Zavarzinia compransoris]TDP48126.1 uncharacterized protein DUF29 [Zavarzinia compransoris]